MLENEFPCENQSSDGTSDFSSFAFRFDIETIFFFHKIPRQILGLKYMFPSKPCEYELFGKKNYKIQKGRAEIRYRNFLICTIFSKQVVNPVYIKGMMQTVQ